MAASVKWWNLPDDTPMAERHRVYIENMIEDAQENLRIHRMIEQRFLEATYPHTKMLDPITGQEVRR